MKVISVRQGTDQWRALRLRHRCASEAPAVMGASKHMTRTELLRLKALGLEKEFSDFVQTRILDKGHEAEAGSRVLVERELGEDVDLFPVTGTTDDGYLWASLDGLTGDDSAAFESKQWNDDLAAQVRAGELEPHYFWQLEQELAVSGAERVIFACSDGTPARHLTMEYRAAPGRIEQLVAAWRQFDADVATFELPPAAEPAPTGRAPDTLPALRIEVTGAVTASNLAEFKATALGAIRSVNRSLKTDQDFADAERAVKWCADVESRIKAAKEHAQSQAADIDALFKTLDDISAEAKAVRLDVDKLVTRRKVEVKEEAVDKARRALDAHIAAVQAEIAPMRLRPVQADFAGAIKGKRSIDSMQDALDTTLAGAKIAADTQARAIRSNVFAFQAKAASHAFLFADLGELVHKPAEDFCVLIDARIAKHRADEAEKERKRQADEAARIAAAEQRAREQEAARIAAQQAEDARVAALARQREEHAEAESARVAAAAPQVAQTRPVDPTPQPTPIEPVAVRPAPAPARAVGPATLTLGVIGKRLGFALTADFLRSIGFAPAGRDRSAVLYHEADFVHICAKLVEHVRQAASAAMEVA